MLVELKSNGRKIEIKKVDFEKFSKDQQSNYTILSKTDSVQAVANVDNTAKTVKKDEAKAAKD